jgi:ribulose kinase
MTREETKVLLPIIQSYAEGKAIESRCIKGDKSLWYDDEDPSFDGDFFAVVGLNDRPTNYDELFEEYIFADGTPFGVKVEE